MPPACGAHWIQRPEVHLIHLFEVLESPGLPDDDLMCAGTRLGTQSHMSTLYSLPAIPGAQWLHGPSG